MALKHLIAASSIALALTATTASAQSTASSCQSSIAPQNAAPSVAPGFRVQVVANGLRDPRSLMFDREGALLVVEQSHGITRLQLSGDGACVKATGDPQAVVEDGDLNHGLELSEDGRTLYASSDNTVFAWDYDSSTGRTTSDARELVTDMSPDGQGHVTRTLLLSRKVPGLLLVSRGSVGNIDLQTLDPASGVSTIKAFNVTNVTDSAYVHASDGLLVGWGLRNSVGIAEEPALGGIYSVENSVDNIQRNGENVHENNPGEEMNFHGYLNGTQTAETGGNYGYPTCFAAWNTSEIPDFDGKTGTQFAMGNQNATINDTFCREDRIAPRITFPAHQAPLDIKFNPNGTAAWVTMHGSWNRDEPIGYKLSFIEFERGSPKAASDSTSATKDIVSNPDMSACPDKCFRPVGLAWDSQGRLFMSSDSTGEIYIITKEDGSGVADVTEATPAPSGTGTGTAPTSTNTNAAVRQCRSGKTGMFWVAGAAAVGAMPML